MNKPMPSPNGTNYEGLYMPGRGTAAYDAAPDGGKRDLLRAFLGDKLGTADMQVVEHLLDGDDDDVGEAGSESDAVAEDRALRVQLSERVRRGEMLASDMDARLRQQRAPRVANAASDAASRFHGRFPGAQKIKLA